jgi:hypothetical protein
VIGGGGRTSRLAAFGLLAVLVSSPAAAAKPCWADGRSSDSAEIASLLSRYGHMADTLDIAGFVGVFTDDGVWDLGASGRFVGSEAIKGFFSKIPGGSRHVTSNYMIDVTGDGTARARSYVTLMGLEDGRPVVRGAGRYEDELVRIGCTWKIKSRTFTPWKSAQ